MWLGWLVTNQRDLHMERILHVIFKTPFLQPFDLGALLSMQMICLACSGSAVSMLFGFLSLFPRLCNHGVFENESLALSYSLLFFFFFLPFLPHVDGV